MIGDAETPSLRSAKARLARGAGNAFVIIAAATGVAFVSQVVLARVLGAEGYGIYAYVTAWITVLALVATLGFQTGMLRFAAAYRAREEWSLLRGVIRYAERRVTLAGLVIGAGTAGVVIALGDRVAAELARTFLVGCAIVPLLALLQVRGSIARAFGGVVSAIAPQNLVRHTVVLVLIAICGLAFSWAIEPHWAMAVMLIATVVALWMTSLALGRIRPAASTTATATYQAHEWRRAMLALLLMAVTRALLSRADLLMLGMLADTTSVGIYAVASRVTDLVAFALTAINTIFAPSIAALHARGDRSALQAMVTTTARWATVSGLLIALPLFVLATVVLSVFGDPFTPGAGALRILLVGQIVNAAAGSVGPMLTMTGHERQAAVVLGVSAVGQIGLNAVLIPLFGLEGAAVANMLTTIAWNLAMAVLVWKSLKIMPSVVGRR